MEQLIGKMINCLYTGRCARVSKIIYSIAIYLLGDQAKCNKLEMKNRKWQTDRQCLSELKEVSVAALMLDSIIVSIR